MSYKDWGAGRLWSIASFTLGAVIGGVGVLFGRGMFSALAADSSSGNAADWWAAAGTWVIGLAATFFAFEARRQAIAADRDRRLARQSQFTYSLARATTLARGADCFIDTPADERTWASYDELLEALGVYAQEVPMPEDTVEHLPHEVIADMIIVNEMLRVVRRDLLREKARVAQIAEQGGVISVHTLSCLKELRGRMHDIDVRSKSVISVMVEKMK